MLWTLKDKEFFKQVIEVLRDRFIFTPLVWQYAFYHKDDLQTMNEYLQKYSCDDLARVLSSSFQSKLYSKDLEQEGFKHLDYYPVVNSRAHSVGEREMWTLNKNFKRTYDTFLQLMSEEASSKRSKPLEDPKHRMILA